jgi:hypothetical protein
MHTPAYVLRRAGERLPALAVASGQMKIPMEQPLQEPYRDDYRRHSNDPAE